MTMTAVTVAVTDIPMTTEDLPAKCPVSLDVKTLVLIVTNSHSSTLVNCLPTHIALIATTSDLEPHRQDLVVGLGEADLREEEEGGISPEAVGTGNPLCFIPLSLHMRGLYYISTLARKHLN